MANGLPCATEEMIQNLDHSSTQKSPLCAAESERYRKVDDRSHNHGDARGMSTIYNTDPEKAVGNNSLPSESSSDEGTLNMAVSFRLRLTWKEILILKVAYELILSYSAPFVAC